MFCRHTASFKIQDFGNFELSPVKLLFGMKNRETITLKCNTPTVLARNPSPGGSRGLHCDLLTFDLNNS